MASTEADHEKRIRSLEAKVAELSKLLEDYIESTDRFKRNVGDQFVMTRQLGRIK